MNNKEREEVKISEDLANPSYHTYSKQALPRFMGYGDHEYQSPIERRNILERAYKVIFSIGHLSDENLISHIEAYGAPESEQRFRRICWYLHGRGRSLIESNVENRVDGTHRSFRQVHQTFEDGMWFSERFGRRIGYIGYGRLITDKCPEGTLWMSHPLNLPIEPLLIFCIDEIPTAHSIFLPEDHKDIENPQPKFCKGARESKNIHFKEDKARRRKYFDSYRNDDDEYEKEHNLMMDDGNGNVVCSKCGMNYYSDTVEITEQKYLNHAQLIRRRFEIQDFVCDEEFHKEWFRQRGRLDPEAEAAIARLFLSDHIAPMRADTEEMAGISGDASKRYRLDKHYLSAESGINPIHAKSSWPHEVKRELSKLLIRVDRKNWEDSTEEERVAILRNSGAHTMKLFKQMTKDELHLRLSIRSEWEFEELIKHVRKDMKSEGSSFAIAGGGKGVRYAMFKECFECNKVETDFGDGHNCICSKCKRQFQGVSCKSPECLLNQTGGSIS
jgi:hypothetical protein